MKEISTIQFKDIDSGDEAVVIVRATGGHVAICISKIHNGDIEVVFRPEECDRLLEALQQAASIAKEQKN